MFIGISGALKEQLDDHKCRSADWVIRVKEFSDGDAKLTKIKCK